MQDAFLQALMHYEDFEGRSSPATWLTRIAINSALMILRRRKNCRTVSLDDGGDSEEWKQFHEVRDHAPDAEQRYLQKERETSLRNAIKGLRPSVRGLVEAVHLGEQSLSEAAEILGMSVGAAKTRLFHARAALRKSRGLRQFRNDQSTHNRSSLLGLRLEPTCSGVRPM